MQLNADALFGDPRFKELFRQEVQMNTIYLAEPLVRGICNQFLLNMEATYKPSPSRGYNQAPSPLRPMFAAWPGSLILRYPDLGASASAMDANCAQVRNDRNAENHLQELEDILPKLHSLRGNISLPALREQEPFLYGIMISADDFAREFLARPRMLKLAHIALLCCKYQLGFPDPSWEWRVPADPKKVRRFVDKVISAVPGLCKNALDFAVWADSVSAEAAQFGPAKVFYPPVELQRRITQCEQLGLFSDSVQASCPFAYKIIKHLNVILSIRAHP